MLLAVCARGGAEYLETGLSVAPLAAQIDAGPRSFFFCERKEPDQPADENPLRVIHTAEKGSGRLLSDLDRSAEIIPIPFYGCVC